MSASSSRDFTHDAFCAKLLEARLPLAVFLMTQLALERNAIVWLDRFANGVIAVHILRSHATRPIARKLRGAGFVHDESIDDHWWRWRSA